MAGEQKVPKRLASNILKVEVILLVGMLIEAYGYFYNRGVILYAGLMITLVGAILGVFFMSASVRAVGIARPSNPS